MFWSQVCVFVFDDRDGELSAGREAIAQVGALWGIPVWVSQKIFDRLCFCF